jgi:hypothetical protein
VLEFIETAIFSKRLRAIAKEHEEDVLLDIQNDLIAAPDRGAVIVGSGGARKARVADPRRGKGKRGGFRYVYYYVERQGQIFLLMIFAKNEQDDLDAAQKKALRAAIESLGE